MEIQDPFVEEHKSEIEKEAFRIYQQRERFLQRNVAEDNFLAAIDIVKRKVGDNKNREIQRYY